MNMKTLRAILSLLLLLSMAVPAMAADMTDYCIVPPYVMRDIQPNVMIILDNSEMTGLPAYTGLSDADNAITAPLALGPDRYAYDVSKRYDGLFQAKLWYYYDGSTFNPQTPDNSVNGKKAVFEGNLLNWITTSRYDLMQMILVGGKSASRQIDAKTLVGINSGDWEERVYFYVGEDGSYNACIFRVNFNDSGGLSITESRDYKRHVIYKAGCGLIKTPPVRPAATYRYQGAMRSGASVEYYALAEERSAEERSLLGFVYGAFNRIIGVFGSDAEAAPALKIVTPTAQSAILPDSSLGVPYSYVPVGTGGSGSYVWSVEPGTGGFTGLPPGLIMNPITGEIYNSPVGPPNTASSPYYYFTIKLLDSGTGAVVYRNANLKVKGELLAMVAPTKTSAVLYNGEVFITDGRRFANYNSGKGYRCLAKGGTPFSETADLTFVDNYGSNYYNWTATGLPAGLSIDPKSGLITGYITGVVRDDPATNYYTVTITAKDSSGSQVQAIAKMLVWGSGLKVTNPSSGSKLPNVTQFDTFSGSFATASGGKAPYSWGMSVSNPGLNLSVNSATGQITGLSRVTAPVGVHSVTLTVTDADGNSTSSTASIEVLDSPLVIVPPIYPYTTEYVSGTDIYSTNVYDYLDDAYQYEPYVGHQMRAKGGSGTYTWSATGLPTGMVINSTTGEIYGTPTTVIASTAQGYTYYYPSIKVSDGYTSTTVGAGIRLYKMGVKMLSPISIHPSISNGVTYTNWMQGVATGGTGGPYTWSATGLPTGMVINPATGVISGMPTGVLTYKLYSMQLSVTDGFDGDYKNINVYVYNNEYYATFGYSFPYSLYINRPTAYVGVPYATDHPRTYFAQNQLTWSLNLGGLPPGLSLNTRTGVISGTPTVSGTYNLTLKVTDGFKVETYGMTLYVYNPSSWNSVYIMEPSSGQWLPSGTVDEPYKGYQPVAHLGGSLRNFAITNTLSWVGENVPEGLTVNPMTGYISGTPTKAYPAGTTITLKLYADGVYRSVSYPNIIIFDNKAEVLTPMDGSVLPTGYVGWSYLGEGSFKPVAWKGSGSYTWSISNAPTWLGINATTGAIDGTPAAMGDYAFQLTVKDSVYGFTNTVTVTLPVIAMPVKTLTSLDPPVENWVTGGGIYTVNEAEYWSLQPTVTGGVPPYTWALVGMPSGMSFNSGSGNMSGYPLPYTQVSTGTLIYNMRVYVCVRDSVGNSIGTINAWGKCDPATTPWKFYVKIVPASDILESADFNLRICMGDYVNNCNSGSVTKHGLLHDKWSEARWGFGDFANDGSPNVTCLPQTNDNSFFTAVENAVPVSVISELVNSIYDSIGMYRGDGAPSCDPFKDEDSPCRRNFILMLTDGAGADNPPVPSGTVPDVFGAADSPAMPAVCAALPYPMAKNACYGYVNDLRPDLEGNQSVSTYIVSAMGTNDAILESAALASDGLFYKANDPSELAAQIAQALEDIIKRAASGTAASVLASGQGTGANLIQALYFPRRQFVDVSTGNKDQISWVGMISDFWYYVDPRFRYNSIREETVQSNPPVLNLVDDYAINMFFNTTNERVEATRYRDMNADGNPETYVDTVEFSEVTNIWEVGKNLWERDLTVNPRTIYTSVDGQNLIAFTNTTARANATLRQYMDATDVDHADAIARWIHGEDITGYRSRTVSADASGVKRVWKLGDILNSTPKIVSPDPVNPSYLQCFGINYREHSYWDFTHSDVYTRRGVVYAGGNDGMLHAFYLGVMNVGEWAGRGAADRARLENDLAGSGVELGDELWSYIPKNALPYLKYQMEGDYCHLYTVDMTPYVVDAMVVADTASQEATDLIPLEGFADAGGQTSSCSTATYEECRSTIHSWKTILIGGMRYGGACEPVTTVNCPVDLNEDGDLTNDCVKAPIADVGFSSYFALDITDTTAPPKLLWEFTHPDLGFSTTGPAVARIQSSATVGTLTANSKAGMFFLNGRWYVIFGSGPTGPIKKSTKQFMAQSDQELKFFAFDLYQGPGANNANVTVIASGIPNAFAGSMIDTTVDQNIEGSESFCPSGDARDFTDDALYMGYVTSETNDSLDANADGVPAVMWNNGGIGRITFNRDLNPANWEFATVMENVGPVTAAPTHLSRVNDPVNKLWVFGASGRYYFLDTDDPDDSQTPGNVVGFPDPCYTGALDGLNPYVSGCTAKVSLAGLADVTTDATAGEGVDGAVGTGWRLKLDSPYTYTNPVTGKSLSFYAERVITDLLANPREGRLYVTAMKPYSDICSIGGVSHVWVFNAGTGGSPGVMKGTAIVQVSTGSIEQVDLATAFDPDNDETRGGRRTSFMIEGLPPMMQGMSMFAPPPPQPRIMHLIQKTQERLQ